MRTRLSRQALDDIDRLYGFLAERDLGAARHALDLIHAAIESLEFFPERGRPTVRDGVRELIVPFGRAGYIIRYRYSEATDTLHVMRIWHGRENRS